MFCLLLFASLHAHSQIDVIGVLSPTDHDISLALAHQDDTLVAGALGMVCYVRGTQLAPLTVPKPLADIVAGVATSNGFMLVETSGTILVVQGNDVIRRRVPDHATGIGWVGDSLFILCRTSICVVDVQGFVKNVIPLGLPTTVIAGACSRSNVILATQDSSLYRFDELRDLRLIAKLESPVNNVIPDRELFHIATEYKALSYSLDKDSIVALSLLGSNLPAEVQTYASRYVFAVDSTRGRVLVHLNPRFGNTLYSPVYACDRVDTVLRVLYTYTVADIPSGYAYSSTLASDKGELVYGRNARCLERIDTSIRARFRESRSYVSAIGRHRNVVAGVISTIESNTQRIEIRYRRIETDSWTTKVVGHRNLRESAIECSMSVFNDSVYVRYDDSLFVVPCDSDGPAQFMGLLPNNVVSMPLQVEPALLVITSSWSNGSFVSTDRGKTWVLIKGRYAVTGGDGYIYSSTYSQVLRRRLVDVQTDRHDTLDIDIPSTHTIGGLFPTRTGVLVFDRDIDQSVPELTHRVLYVEDGTVVRELAFVNSSPAMSLGLPVHIGHDSVGLFLGFGGILLLLDPTTGLVEKKEFDLSAINRYGVVFDGQTDVGNPTHLSMISTRGFIVEFDLSTPTSVQDDPNLQWVAIRNAYPNPAERVLNVTISSLPTADYATWRIGLYRLDGSLTVDCKPYTAPWTMNSTVQTISVPISGLPQGMYYLASVNRGYAESRQVVVVR
ncbi:MAG: hypothetical protein IPI24_06340 [Ignavibacteria bacterium]|nr:hypothetical protein [Ignavibacteria bacterium]